MGCSKILFTLPFAKEMITSFDACIDFMQTQGYEVIVDIRKGNLNEEALMAYAPDIVANICGSNAWTRRTIEAFPQLRVISRMGVGYDSIDVAAATEHGVGVAVGVGKADLQDVAAQVVKERLQGGHLGQLLPRLHTPP